MLLDKGRTGRLPLCGQDISALNPSKPGYRGSMHEVTSVYVSSGIVPDFSSPVNREDIAVRVLECACRPSSLMIVC